MANSLVANKFKRTPSFEKNYNSSRLDVAKNHPYLANTTQNKDVKVTSVRTISDEKNGSGGTGGQATATPTQDSSAMLIAYMKEMEARQKKAANDAYDRNVSSMNDAFKQRGDLLKNNLNSTLQNLQTDYDASKANVNQDAGKSLQEAYINSMLSRKNLAQNMAAQGLSGGASETTMAGMYNNYGNARNTIQNTANENLGNLENLYNQNKNSAYQAYNDQLAQDAITKAQYMTQFENDRQNALATAYNNQLSQMMSLDPTYAANMLGLVQEQSAYTPVATTVVNTPATINTSQGSSSNQGSSGDNTQTVVGNYPRFALRLAQQMAEEGSSAEDIMHALGRNSVSSAGISAILAQLGL